MQGYIYKITNPSGRIYIGQTIHIKKRYGAYKGEYDMGQPKIYNSIKKYSMDKHSFEIVYECPKELLDYVESAYIRYYNSVKEGLNCKEGGSRSPMTVETIAKRSAKTKGRKRSVEFCEKMREINTGKIMSQESKDKMSKSRKGKKKPLSEEGKANIRKGIRRFWEENKGKVDRKKTEEHKRNIGIANKGKKKVITKEWRENIGKSIREGYASGTRKTNKGKIVNEETKKKISNTLKKLQIEGKKKSNAKPIVQLSKDGKYIKEWPSIVSAEKELKLSSIHGCCSRKPHCKSIGGYKWMYASEYYKDKEVTEIDNN